MLLKDNLRKHDEALSDAWDECSILDALVAVKMTWNQLDLAGPKQVQTMSTMDHL